MLRGGRFERGAMQTIICIGQGVGNVVMATPMIRAFADMGHTVDVLCKTASNASELLRGWPAIRTVFDTDTHPTLALTGYDLAVRGVWCPIHWPPVTIRGRDYISPDVLDMRTHHEAEVNMTAPRKLGFKGETPPAHVQCDHPGVRAHDTIFAPGIGGTGPGWERKFWPHWRELAEALPDRPAILGAAIPYTEPHDGWVDYRGKTTLREAAGIMASAKRVIAVDNGLAHMAAALGVETHVLFGFTSPTKNKPLGPRVNVITAGMDCQPCQMTEREVTCHDAKCMEALSVERVLGAIAI